MNKLLPLVAKGAETAHRGKRLVGPIHLTLGPTGTTVVIGPNGSGKTTLLRLLQGTARLTGGSIDWACALDEARHHQAFVFQRPVMLRRSVLDNIAYPLRVKGTRPRSAREAAAIWADRLGLGPLKDRSATGLSGGEQQKLALARALITKPAVLFLDEPCAALDGRATREIEAVLAEVRDAGTRLILATHDMGQARRFADDVIFLLHGRVHEQSPAALFFNEPQTDQAAAFLRGDIVE